MRTCWKSTALLLFAGKEERWSTQLDMKVVAILCFQNPVRTLHSLQPANCCLGIAHRTESQSNSEMGDTAEHHRVAFSMYNLRYLRNLRLQIFMSLSPPKTARAKTRASLGSAAASEGFPTHSFFIYLFFSRS